MLIISYDIADDKVRTRFAKMLTKHGAIRLQYSVYEVANTKRIRDLLVEKVRAFAKNFKFDDSVVIFSTSADDILKFGNAIHRDAGLVVL